MRWWLDQDCICWGLFPVIAAGFGYIIPVVLIESYLPYGVHFMINHTKKKTRTEMIADTQNRIPWMKQFKEGVNNVLGPAAIVSGILSSFLARYLQTKPTEDFPDLKNFVWNLILLEIIGDFGLYWGHRVQHEFDFLWEHHAYHHSIDTPTPASTVYIDPLDSFLQGSLPMMIAAVCVQPHPITFTLYVFSRVFQNTVNHSGMDHPFLNLICLRYTILGRAKVKHHDLHHRFSNYARNAKNYGEMFWVWDWMFGTLRA